MHKSCDYLVIGAGIMGLSIARELSFSKPNTKIIVIEKEKQIAFHASGRNSGVLHAGFYYSADSLKAKFTKEGNQMMKEFCFSHQIPINPCGKVVVASNRQEISGLEELKKRADRNQIDLKWVTRQEVDAIDPNINFYGDVALYSPTTATVDPEEVCKAMAKELVERKVEILLDTSFLKQKKNVIETCRGCIEAGYVINAAGLYADKIAQKFGLGKDFTLLPFKGVYLKSKAPLKQFRTNIYPVPNLKHPFLGVHFTITADYKVKIGPTAIPSFWRENYQGFERFSLKETLEVLSYESKLFLLDSFHFRSLAFEEIKKYNRRYLLGLASKLVKFFDTKNFQDFARPGIRAQLLHKKDLKLVQDFVIEKDQHSLHVLNAVSPAFTCSIPFARWIVQSI